MRFNPLIFFTATAWARVVAIIVEDNESRQTLAAPSAHHSHKLQQVLATGATLAYPTLYICNSDGYNPKPQGPVCCEKYEGPKEGEFTGIRCK
jgi:hypothetical protein